MAPKKPTPADVAAGKKYEYGMLGQSEAMRKKDAVGLYKNQDKLKKAYEKSGSVIGSKAESDYFAAAKKVGDSEYKGWQQQTLMNKITPKPGFIPLPDNALGGLNKPSKSVAKLMALKNAKKRMGK